MKESRRYRLEKMWRWHISLPRISSILKNKNEDFKINFLLSKRLVRVFSKAVKTSSTCELHGGLLRSRSLIRVCGKDSEPFLQGLITNDIGHLEPLDRGKELSTEGSSTSNHSIYTLLLNHQGRVLFDAFVYRHGPALDGHTFLIDCHTSLKDKLIRHLKLFRVKKEVEIQPADDFSAWVIYKNHAASQTVSTSTSTPIFNEEDSCCAPLTPVILGRRKREDLPLKLQPSLEALKPMTFGDPRVSELGWRLILPTAAPESLFKELRLMGESSYRQLRYSLGVAEGPEELIFATAFPLESNGDYLHGISFQKGCYVGQELTARTHHTGVVRKRLMPFRLDGEGKVEVGAENLEIVNEKGKSIGKVRGLEGRFGIALIRIEEAFSASKLTLKGREDQVVSVTKPNWWPIHASKEIHSSGTSSRK